MLHISFAQSASNDLLNIKRYYKLEGVEKIGQQFVTSIIEHIKTLEKHPNIGRIVPEFNNEKIREIIHSPFRIVYLYEQNSINIIRVWRSERLLSLSKH
jgi:plasmid stabilization system protein ParE